MSESNIPNKVLGVFANTSTPLESWPYDDGAGDPHWSGGATPVPYRWKVDFTVDGEQVHSSHLTRKPYRYNGLDVNVGDWIAATGTGRALKITEVTVKTELSFSVIVEDVDRYNTFIDPLGSGVFNIPGSCVLFEISEANEPILEPMPPSISQVTFAPQVVSRFKNNPPTYRYRFSQSSNGFVLGDAVWVNPVSRNFEKATEGAGAKDKVGTVVGVVGEDVFYLATPTKILESLVPILPGEKGDKIYLDATGALSVTPNSDNKVSYIQVSDPIADEVVGTVVAPSTVASNVISINGTDVTFSTGALAQSIIEINNETINTDVVASEVLAPTIATTVIGDTTYGIVGMTGNTAASTINGVAVVFDITDAGTIAFGTEASNEVDMAESINNANIPNIVASHASGKLTITEETGGVITIVNVTSNGDGANFAGPASGSGVALSTASSTDSFLKLSNAKGYGITLQDITGTPIVDFGIGSVANGSVPFALVVEQGGASGSGEIEVFELTSGGSTPHVHSVSLSDEEVKDLIGGVVASVVKESSTADTHTHNVTIVYNSGLGTFSASLIDGNHVGTEHTFVQMGGGSGSGGDALVTTEFDVIDVEQGQYTDGDTITVGTSIEDVVKNMLQKTIPPVYVSPSVNLTGTNPKDVEAGTTLNLTFDSVFNQNDAGAITAYRLYKESTGIHSDTVTSQYVESSYVIIDESITYHSEVDYLDGSVKDDNTGTPDSNGQILAGTVNSNNAIYNGHRNMFYGVGGGYVTSADIRSLSDSYLNPSNGTTRGLTNVSSNNLIIAYPATLRDVNSVSMVSGGFTFQIIGVQGWSQESNIMVNDASGGNPISYKVFRYEPPSAFENVDFSITI